MSESTAVRDDDSTLDSLGREALAVLCEIMGDADAGPKARVKAARTVLRFWVAETYSPGRSEAMRQQRKKEK
jgi:hypothetical protein